MDLSDFIAVSQRAKSASEVVDCWGRFVGGFGYERFMTADLSSSSTAAKEEQLGVIVNYPDAWFDRYLDKHYVNHDPIYRKGMVATKPFTWKEAHRDYPDGLAGQVMGEAREFGLRDGIGLIIDQPQGRRLGIGLSCGETGARMDAAALGVLHAASFHFLTAYSELGMKAAEPVPVTLSAREREILCWISWGKNKGEVADILGIGESTVKRHCESLFRKLSVNSLAHAVAKAIRTRLID